VPISSPARVLYPALGFTKLDLATLYADLAEWVLPHVHHRPLTMVRCEHGASAPDALRTQCQFLRHSAGWHRFLPASVRRVHVQEQKKVGEYVAIDSLDALLRVINGDILELHTWSSTIDHLETPDRLVFDLDPAPDVGWRELVAAALRVRAQLERLQLTSFAKSTGGKGLHVVVPLEPRASWDDCFAFSRAFASVMSELAPETFTIAFDKRKRAGKILIDYKRNHRTAIAIAAFSTRARPEATLSVPLRWEELDPRRPLRPYTVRDVRQRVRAWRHDPWRDYAGTKQRLPLPRA
jgi:bifunctional non-homologous end joining protein LigD